MFHAPPEPEWPVTPVTTECLVHAAAQASVHPAILLGIIQKEGGRPGSKVRNKNGTIDHGPMQVNSVWLAGLARFGISPSLLANNGCVNVHVGAWILDSHIKAYGGDVWKAVGAYHSKTPVRRDAYAAGVAENVMRLYQGQAGHRR
jgi:soluble lytic murein transglycosylase-like protein